MKKDIIKCFNLTGVILEKIINSEDVCLHIRNKLNVFMCPHCEKKIKTVYDKKERKILHGVFDGKRILLILKVRRFKCRYCQRVFTEPKPFGISRKKYSENLTKEVLKHLINSNFKNTSLCYKLSPPTLISILKENESNQEFPKGDLKLNIDEHSFSGRDLKITVGEINNHKLLSILGDDNQYTLKKYLRNLPEDVKTRISEVCIDMKTSYLYAIKEELPEASIVVDRFHIVKEMIRQVEEIRKINQHFGRIGKRRMNRFLLIKNREDLSEKELKELRAIFIENKKFPALHDAYFVKEKVREIYRSKSIKEAERKFDILISQLEHVEVGKLAEMRDTLKRWRPYILNFFISGTTNGFIEGCHNKIKLIKRMSYGFRNFENYVLKITLAFLPYLFINLPHLSL